jgi:hypothetical protein
MWRPEIVAAILLLSPAAAFAQPFVVTIYVTDSTGTPIPYVSVAQRGGTVVTDRAGTVRLTNVGRGRLTAQLRRIGFSPEQLSVAIAGDTTISVMMAPIATLLAAQQIVAQSTSVLHRTGFYDRMHDRQRGLNNGFFITPEDLERRRPQRVTHALSGAPNTRIEQVPGVGGVPRSATDGCAYTIYIDGVRVQTFATDIERGTSSITQRPVTRGGDRWGGIDELVSATSVEAIEVYPRGANAPQRYQMLSGTCGIIAIWTKA